MIKYFDNVLLLFFARLSFDVFSILMYVFGDLTYIDIVS